MTEHSIGVPSPTESVGSAGWELVKVGGSLNSWSDLPRFLRRWLANRRFGTLLLFGGGELVDRIRRRQRALCFDDPTAHWHAIRALRVQGRCWARLLQLPFVDAAAIVQRPFVAPHPLFKSQPRESLEIDPLQTAGMIRACVLDPVPALFQDAGRTLPVGWHVTSDSIAGWFARRYRMRSLTLLKSIGRSQEGLPPEAIERGWVDPAFPTVIGGVAVRWCNPRQDEGVSLHRGSPDDGTG